MEPMSQLCLYLPPFSSDYAGVCSALFELNGMVVIHDASCCSRNYTGFDEPRWFGNRRPIFCSGLREIDAIMGDDEKLLRKICNGYHALSEKPDFLALLGSPVPTIIGADMPGIAQEAERTLGIPALGFSTTGLRYYNVGIREAMLALTKRFTRDPSGPARGVNLLGLTPLDYSDNCNGQDVIAQVQAGGFPVVCSYMMGLTLDDIRRAAEAQVNLVLSQSGLGLARYMKKRWGIPYVAGAFVGSDPSAVLSLLHQTCRDGADRFLHAPASGQSHTLIVGDQVIANSIRCRLIEQFGLPAATVATFFDLDSELAQEGDVHLHSEEELCQLQDGPQYCTVIADPLVGNLPEMEGKAFFPLPHVAISSKLYWHAYPVFQSQALDGLLEEAARQARL